MPANKLSFAVTGAYREQWESVKRSAEALARANWTRLDTSDLDASYAAWQTITLVAVRGAQGQAVTASNGYTRAFLASELGREVDPVSAPLNAFVGRSRDGRALADALASPLIAVKVALGAGKDMSVALREGQNRALRMVGLEIDHTARASLQANLIEDPRIESYRRAVRGTCGACLAAASKSFDARVHFPVHPGCACVTEPEVRGVPNRFPRPTGAELFAAMSAGEQDEAVGPEVAALLRNGSISLEDLLGTSPQETTPDFLTQKPTSALV